MPTYLQCINIVQKRDLHILRIRSFNPFRHFIERERDSPWPTHSLYKAAPGNKGEATPHGLPIPGGDPLKLIEFQLGIEIQVPKVRVHIPGGRSFETQSSSSQVQRFRCQRFESIFRGGRSIETQSSSSQVQRFRCPRFESRLRGGDPLKLNRVLAIQTWVPKVRIPVL